MTKANSSGIVYKAKLSKSDPRGWYEARDAHETRDERFAIFYLGDGRFSWFTEGEDDEDMADEGRLTDFVGPLVPAEPADCPEASNKKESLWPLFHSLWTKDVETEGYQKARWVSLEAAIMNLERIHSSDCPECAKLVEFFRSEEIQAGLDGDAGALSPADAILKLARERKVIIDGLRHTIDGGVPAVIDLIEKTLKECGVAYTASERKLGHLSIAETFAEVRRRLLPFELPPPGSTFRAEVDTDQPARPRMIGEFHHFDNGRISGDLGEQWKLDDFVKRNAVLIQE